MNRRMLLLYTGMWITGIVAGYICWERHRIPEGIGLLLAVSGSVVLLYFQVGKNYGLTWNQLRWMEVVLVVSFLLFSLNFSRLYVDESICKKDGHSLPQIRILEQHNYEDHVTYVGEGSFASGKRKLLINDYSGSEEGNLIGTTVTLAGELRIPDGPRNPGCFNYQLYLKTKEISYVMTAKSIQQLHTSIPLRLQIQRQLREQKERFLQQLEEKSGVRGFLQGILFGERSELDEEIYQEFSENGTAHILAVSGLHVGFLIALLNILARKRKYWKITLGIFAVLFLYGEMTGWSPSTLRAVMIAVLSMSGMYLNRNFDLTTGTAATALAVLLIQPYQLFQSGFLMSYLAILGMAFLTKPLTHFVGEFMASLLSIQIVMIPFQIYCFHRFNPMTLAINIPIIFLASILVPWGVVLFFLGNFLPLPAFTLQCLSVLTKLLIQCNHLLYWKGEFTALLPSVGPAMLICFYLLLLFVNSEWCRVMVLRRDLKSIRRTMGILLIPSILLVLGFWNRFGNDGVVFIDVGQGAAMHLRSGHRNLLIDGGGNANYKVGEKVLLPYFLGNGITSLDYAICTHLHMDHFQGVQELSTVFPVKAFAVPSAYRGIAGTPANSEFLRQGDEIRVTKELSIQVLWPLEDSTSTPENKAKVSAEDLDENELTGIYRIQYRGIRILVTGDILEAGEEDMLQYYAGTEALKCDVLAVAHHGSRSSSSEAFLDAVNPCIAVIQVGNRNLYGHPHPETLKKLKARNIAIYRTDQSGAIGLQVPKWGEQKQIKIDRMMD